MEHSIGILVPIFICLGAFMMVFGLRYLKNQERMAMIAKGMTPPVEQEERRSPQNTMRKALLFIGAGCGLLLAMFLDHTLYYSAADPDEGKGLYFALIAIGAGIGLLLSTRLAEKNKE
jgi:hypothetical protein